MSLATTLEFVRSDRSKDPDNAYNTSPDTAVYPIGVDRLSKTDWSCMATLVESKLRRIVTDTLEQHLEVRF